MRRISHDLPGLMSRIARLGDEFEVAVKETSEAWRDEKGRVFLQQHCSDARPVVSQLVTAMAQTIELMENISKQLRDPQE